MSLRRSKAAAAERRKTILEKPNPAGRQYYSITIYRLIHSTLVTITAKQAGLDFPTEYCVLTVLHFSQLSGVRTICQPLLAKNDKEFGSQLNSNVLSKTMNSSLLQLKLS